MSNAYPLDWPPGWPRTEPHFRVWAKFKKAARHRNESEPGSGYIASRQITISEGVQRVQKELRVFGVQYGDAVISTNLQLRLDGVPRGNQPEPSDPGVAVYWSIMGDAPKVMAIDIYARVADNLAAVAATLDAMRAIERHGGARVLERAFTGFAALPAPGQTHARGWPEVLELNGDATIDKARANYRRLSGIRHPDRPGGSHDAMSELNWAWAQAQEALK